MVRLERRLGGPHRFAPQPGGVQQFGMIVGDVEVHRLRRFAFEDDHVPSGHLQFRAEIAARIRTRDGAGQRALGDDGIAAASRCHGPGQRPGGPDNLVFRRQRIDGRIDFLYEILGCESALADVVARPLHIQFFGFAGAGGQVDAQDFSSP